MTHSVEALATAVSASSTARQSGVGALASTVFGIRDTNWAASRVKSGLTEIF